jgi:hypothetical protein
MMPRIIAVCCVIVGASCLAGGIGGALRPVSLAKAAEAKPAVAETDQDRLQQLANTSCRCERRAGPKGKDVCWAAFDAQMPEQSSTDAMTTCLPVPQTMRCTHADKPPADPAMDMDIGTCVTTEYRYEGGGGEVRLCSKEEAAAVERVWNREVSADPQRNSRTPMADKLARDLAAGKPIPVTSGPGGCASS